MMPLFHVKGHELVSLNGKLSSFYQLVPSDMEGIPEFTQEKIFFDLEKDIVNCEEQLKIYWLGERLFINSFSDFKLTHGEMKKNPLPLEEYFGTYPQEINFYENYLTCGNDYLRVFSFKEFPSFIEKFDTLNWPDFVMNIRKIPNHKAKSTINFKRKLHYSGLFKGIKDLDSENAYDEAENMLEKITRGDTALLQIECFLILKASSKEDLDLKSKQLHSRFKMVDAILFQEERGLSYFYQSLIPGVEPSFKRAQLCSSSYICQMIPFHRDHVHENGIEVVSRRYHKIFWNIFNPSAINYNVLITGTSGQGKSMMANKILAYELKNDSKAVILDLGNSFYKTTRYFDGTILSKKFNPLQFTNPFYLKEFVLAVIDEEMSKMEQGRLFHSISSIIEKGLTNFDEFLNELEKDFKGISFYFTELREFFTDRNKALSDLTYCDFSNYPDAMKAPLIIYLIEYFKNLQGKKIFIFDECWHLLNKNADYIAECFRTFRKHHASAIAISQNLDDFSITQLGRVIIQNTYWKLLFRQNLAETEFVDSHAIDLLESLYSKKGVGMKDLNSKKDAR